MALSLAFPCLLQPVCPEPTLILDAARTFHKRPAASNQEELFCAQPVLSCWHPQLDPSPGLLVLQHSPPSPEIRDRATHRALRDSQHLSWRDQPQEQHLQHPNSLGRAAGCAPHCEEGTSAKAGAACLPPVPTGVVLIPEPVDTFQGMAVLSHGERTTWLGT